MLTPTGILRLLACGVITIVGAAHVGCAPPRPPRGVGVAAGDLQAEMRGNTRRDHQSWLSGCSRLHNVRGGGNAWEKEGGGKDWTTQAVGLNFEHILTRRPDPRNDKEPRHGAFDITAVSSSGVTLTRLAADSAWKVSTTLRYDLVAPCYVDFSMDSVVTSAAEFGPDRACSFFFASYMNEPVSDAEGGADLFFLGVPAAGAPEQWCRSDPAHFAQTFTGLGAQGLGGSDLAMGQSAWPRLTRPFVYGRQAGGNVYLLMLDHLGGSSGGFGTADEESAFTLLKWVRGERRRPAWDFSYRVRNLQDGTRVRFRGRLVWKRWVDEDDCRREFETWYAGLSSRPACP